MSSQSSFSSIDTIISRSNKYANLKPSQFFVASKAPDESGEFSMHTLPLSEFESKFNFSFNDGYQCDEGLLSQLPKEFSTQSQGMKRSVPDPSKYFVVVPMDTPKGTLSGSLGYGLHYRMTPKSLKQLPEQTMMMPYAGKLVDSNSISDQSYFFNVFGSIGIDAKQSGGLGRFAAHLPEELEVKLLDGEKGTLECIARANMDMKICRNQKGFGMSLISTSIIKPGQMLGYSYNIEYFLQNNFLPCYYDAKGRAIDTASVKLNGRKLAAYALVKTTLKEWTKIINSLIDEESEETTKLRLLHSELSSLVNMLNSPKTTFEDFEENLLGWISQAKGKLKSIDDNLIKMLIKKDDMQSLTSIKFIYLRLNMLSRIISIRDSTINDDIKLVMEGRYSEFSMANPSFILSEFSEVKPVNSMTTTQGLNSFFQTPPDQSHQLESVSDCVLS